MTGRRRAKRDGNPTASAAPLLGAPVDALVGPPPAKNHRFHCSALSRRARAHSSALYELDQHAFDLAIELLRDWRLDRYYAARIKLFDVALSGVMGQPEVSTP
jgi:hypothetical protein